MTFGELLKKHMTEAGVTMRDLEKQTNIDIAHISRIVNDKINNPGYMYVAKLKNALSISNYDVESCFGIGGQGATVYSDKEIIDNSPLLLQMQHELLNLSDTDDIIQSLDTFVRYLKSEQFLLLVFIRVYNENKIDICKIKIKTPTEQECPKLMDIFFNLYNVKSIMLFKTTSFKSIISNGCEKDIKYVNLTVEDILEKIKEAYLLKGTLPFEEYITTLHACEMLDNKTRNYWIEYLKEN